MTSPTRRALGQEPVAGAVDAPRRHGGPSGPALPALDGLRAVAVLAVLLTHVGFQTGVTARPGQVGALLSRLDVGVTLFFLLSGFLLYRPYAVAHQGGGPAPDLRRYLRNRALRILPAYWVLVLVAVPALSPDEPLGPELLLQLLLLQTAEPGHLLAGLTQTWSLAVEAAFYLLLPALALLTRPRRPRSADAQLRAELVLLAGMVAVALTWRLAVHAGDLGDVRVTGLWLPGYLDWFALGMALAVLRGWAVATGRGDRMREVAWAWGSWTTAALLLLWVATTPLAGPRGLEPPTAWEAVVKHLLYGALAACLLVPLVLSDEHHPWTRLMSSRPARHLGRISYGVFLWHLIALDVVYRLPWLEPFTGRFGLVLVLTLAVSVALAELSLRLVEAPALRWKRPA